MRALSEGEHCFRRWLSRKRAAAVALNLLAAVASLAAGVAVLAVTFVITYVAVLFGFGGISGGSELLFSKPLPMSTAGICVISGCFLALLFVEHARVSRDYWADYPAPHQGRWSVLAYAGVTWSFVALLANAGTSARMIADILLTGPRLMGACVRAVRRSLLLARADLQTLASAFRILAGSTSPIAVADLCAGVAGRGASGLLSQLTTLGALIFTRREPLRVILEPELREQLRTMLFAEAAPNPEHGSEPERAAAAPADEALFEVLGLSPTASLNELRAAYRKKMKQWHPDVFAGPSEEARHIAEEKTKEIIAAYQELLTRYRGEREEELCHDGA
jgi:hypothetical protein